jgi:hypothetical protein
MKDDRDNIPRNDYSTPLDENIGRLLKVADSSNRPGGKFTESLIGRLDELGQSRVAGKNKTHGASELPWLEKSLGWAAMVAAACSAGLAIVASMFLKMNFVLQSIVGLTMIFNWFTTLGEYIR